MDIEVIVVELAHCGKMFPGSRLDVINYLAERNYQHIGNMVVDDFFIRRDLISHKYQIDYSSIKQNFPLFKKFDDQRNNIHEEL